MNLKKPFITLLQQPPPGGGNPEAECNDPDSRYIYPSEGVRCDHQTGFCIKMSS
jgi:hypothetical protein